ncbi:MAG: hypothetical protein ABF747_04390 [Bifidobacterium sp.]|uniref:Uncharacterized protein n=1 Tax=Bifidobacterium fermentum TaxID=3059035 RepID=A0AB39UDX1_9BIFI
MIHLESSESNRKKRKIILLAFLGTILLMIAALWAFFTDFNTGYHTVTAGSLDIKQSFALYHNDVLVGKNIAKNDPLDSNGGGADTSSDPYVDGTISAGDLTDKSVSPDDGDADGIIENFNPGDTVTLKVKVQNYGTKSLWLRPSLRLTGAAIDPDHDGTHDETGATDYEEYNDNFVIYEQVSRLNYGEAQTATGILSKPDVWNISGNGYSGASSLSAEGTLAAAASSNAGRALTGVAGVASPAGTGFTPYSENSNNPYDPAAAPQTAATVWNALRYTSNRLFILDGQNAKAGALSNPADSTSYYGTDSGNDTRSTGNAQDNEYEGTAGTSHATASTDVVLSSGNNIFMGTHTIEYTYTIYFKPTALNEMQGTNLSVGYLLEAVQYRNNGTGPTDIRIKSGTDTAAASTTNTVWNSVDGWRDVVRLENE